MARRKAKGKMSEDQRKKISDSVREKVAKRRAEKGLPEVEDLGINLDPREIEIIQMKDEVFDPELFIPMKTDKGIDNLFSTQGGIPKACNFIIIGDPGVGKTTVSMDILADLNEKGFDCLFISAEMTKIDLFEYCERYPKFGTLDILFLGEYIDDNPKEIVERAVKPGYDVILIDSFAEVQEAVKESSKMSTAGSMKWLIDIMIKQNLGNNDKEKHTTFLAIQQVTKEGVFIGSNKLKHNTTGMMELRYEGDDDEESYIEFTKNRRGKINKKLYFSLDSKVDVQYDMDRFNKEHFHSDKSLQESFDELEEAGEVLNKILKEELEINKFRFNGSY